MREEEEEMLRADQKTKIVFFVFAINSIPLEYDLPASSSPFWLFRGRKKNYNKTTPSDGNGTIHLITKWEMKRDFFIIIFALLLESWLGIF